MYLFFYLLLLRMNLLLSPLRKSHAVFARRSYCNLTQLVHLLVGVWLLGGVGGWHAALAQSFSPTDKLQFEHLGEAQGVRETWVVSICQDQEGFMWFGTYDGLYKYDGHVATSYTANPADSDHSLRSNIVTAVHEDQQDRIWVSTGGGGLHQVNKRTGEIKAYPINGTRHSNRWNQLTGLYEDKQGILWLGTAMGIARFDPDSLLYTLYPTPNGKKIERLKGDATGKLWSGSYQLDPKTKKYTLFPLPTSFESQLVSPYAFYIDAEGIAWTGTHEDGLFRMDTKRPSHYTPYNPKGLINKTIHGIYEADGYLWLATTEGLQRVDKNTEQVLTYRSDPSLPGSLNTDLLATGLYYDRAGNLWVGSAFGVNKASLLPKPFQTFQITPSPASFHRPENEMFSVLEDQYGTVWVGSAAKGLYRIDPTAHQFMRVVVNPADKRTNLNWQRWPLLEDTQGRLWVGTDMEKGLYQLDRERNKFIRYPCPFSVSMLDQDATGKLWIGGQAEIASFDPLTKQFTYYRSDENDSTSLLPGNITGLMVSRKGEVWVALKEGISRLNPNTGKFVRYQPQEGFLKGHLNAPHVNALYEDQQGIIWVGTDEGGLNRLDPNTHTFTYFTKQDGLPSNDVLSIIGDKRGNLWIGTNRGLSRYNPKTNSFRNFDVSDGLPGNEFEWKGSVYGHHGKLFFGNRDGLVVFHPDSIRDDPATFPVYITGLTVLEENRPLADDTLELDHGENFISLQYAALNYTSPQKTRYAYQLVGVDPHWVQAASQRVARYTDLAPGKYTFRVKATTDGKVWNNKEARLTIIIHPPWWHTYWAYCLYAILLTISLLLARREVVRRERLKTDLKIKQLESEKLKELDMAKSHFFTNISHEFRTPLSLIKGIAEKLEKKYPASADKQDFQLIDCNADRLLVLINQVLDLSKLEAGKLVLHAQPGELTSLLRVVAASFASLYETKGIAYQCDLPEGPLWVIFDRDKLEKILSNLLSNAYKFTPSKGEVHFSVAAERDDTHCLLMIQVQDSGIGITQEQLPRIFERFHQVDTSSTRAYEGTGIGLALVKELVELHCGQISVESTAAQGTTFIVRLPFELVSEQTPEEVEYETNVLPMTMQSTASAFEAEALAGEALGTKPKENSFGQVLVIEDQADLRKFISGCLAQEYQVLEAADGVAGYTIAQETMPDLIISDVMMPGMNGITLCEKLKTEERTSHIPVILLTAKADAESKLQGLETGAEEYLTKPFHLRELQLRVRNLLESRQKLQQHLSKRLFSNTHFSNSHGVAPVAVKVSSADERFLKNALAIAEENISNAGFDVESFCRQIGMSRTHLHRKLTALTGQSTSEFIKLIRLKRAASLLRQQHGNVSEIAFLVGFSSQNYFTKCFKEHYGQTPSEYLRNHPLANSPQV